jgi:glucuronosyltransferase
MVIVFPFFGNEAGYFLAQRFNASLVLYFSTQTAASWVDRALGQPHNPSYLPNNLLPYTTDMNFVQRVVNVAVGLFAHHVMRSYYMLGKTRDVLRKHFPGEDIPDLIELEKTASLAFSFGHPLLLDGWRPQTPNHIYLGMMNCRGTTPLDNQSKLKQFLDSAKEGVIYVSFGTVLRGSSIPEDMRKTFLSHFSNLKLKVLWKWETETMEDLPPNVLLSKWLPQQEVLAHPNVKLFITHAGQSSFQESLCHGKPMVSFKSKRKFGNSHGKPLLSILQIAIPILGDQLGNGAEVERLKVGFNVPFRNFNVEKFIFAVNTILEDPSYRTRASDFGKVLMDQINNPLDRAVWWIEHVLRHPKLYSGRSPVHKLYWFQYFLLDVIAFYCVLILTFLIIIYKCSQRCCKKSGQLLETHEKKMK